LKSITSESILDALMVTDPEEVGDVEDEAVCCVAVAPKLMVEASRGGGRARRYGEA
jgi:hypothetical protein